MSYDNPKGGIGNAAEFQSSALPYVTSSTTRAAGDPVRLDLPKVSRFITVTNRDATFANSMSFGFTRAGVVSTNKKYTLMGGQSVTLEVRVKELWLQGESSMPAYSLCAGLTNIGRDMMPVLSGTLPDGSPGWDGAG
jgi:hypothetical protein